MRVLLPLVLLAFASPAPAQEPVHYEVRFPNAVHHEAEISVTFPNLPDRPLEVRMSRTSPGRYALHEFAKNVYNVRAFDGAGNELPIRRPNLHQWDVAGHDGTVTVRYTLYADHADGTYPGIDVSHAHLNMPGTFLWARGMEDRPIRVTFHPPEGSGWKVATQLVPTDDPYTFTAPDFHYFMDSPTELSDFALREWPVESNGETYTIRLAVHHAGSEADVDRYTEMAKKVVRAQMEIFGELPDFDYGSYTFLADYLPWVYGDGMEHRNSTILTSRRALEGDGALRNLGTLSHEFFHAWNMERLRADAIEPFDFEHANMSKELWFGEGFTSYYDDLAIARAGLIDLDEYARRLGGTLNYVLNSPGRRFFSAVEMSMQAPFVDAATSVDATNRGNTFISYYSWGAVLGLGLDLTLRTRYDLTLDDYMRALWQRHGRPEVPYTMADLKAVLAELTGDRAFAEAFFARYVEGHEVMDYEALLAQAGLLLRHRTPERAYLGSARIRYADGAATLVSGTRIGSPLYRAGLDRGDRILRLDGRTITSRDDLEAVLSAHRPGDRVTIEFWKRGTTRTATLTLEQNPALEVVPFEAAGREVTDAMRALREAWLGTEALAGV